MSVPKMHSGGIGAYNAMLAAPLYEKIGDILGDTGLIIPLQDLGMPFGTLNGRTWRRSSTGVTSDPTFSESPSAWDTPFNFNDPDCYQGIIPFLDFNGTDEYVSYPDDAYWSRDDAGGANGFSMGVWVNLDTISGGSDYFIAKWDNTTSAEAREWRFIHSNGKPTLILYDESVNAQESQGADAAVALSQWVHIVVTYGGAGGTPAGSADMAIYVNGTLVADTASNTGTYVGMEASTGPLYIGGYEDSAGAGVGTFDGKMAGGALGPFYTHADLTAAQVAQLYRLGRQALEL